MVSILEAIPVLSTLGFCAGNSIDDQKDFQSAVTLRSIQQWGDLAARANNKKSISWPEEVPRDVRVGQLWNDALRRSVIPYLMRV